MKIGILQADSVMPQFQPAHGDYPAMIEKILLTAAAEMGESVECVTYNVVEGVYPDTYDECDGYVITGSKQSVYDPDDWIKGLRDYVVVLHEAVKPLFGICFGHQIIADTLGGKTEGAAVGWGVGAHHYDILDQHWCMSPELNDYSVLVSHRDQVTQLPEEAKLLASSEFCPNAMFSMGDHILALQGHPEFLPAYSQDLMDFRREMIGEDVYSTGVASLEGELQSPQIAKWMVRFLKGDQSV